MEQKANILVAEVLDTELIGEGAIKTYQEAHKHLMEEDCISVPHLANVYVQVVDSKLASSWYRFEDIELDGKVIVKAPNNVRIKNVHFIFSIMPLLLFT
jgi:protein arginine N-methyltransferase 7